MPKLASECPCLSPSMTWYSTTIKFKVLEVEFNFPFHKLPYASCVRRDRGHKSTFSSNASNSEPDGAKLLCA